MCGTFCRVPFPTADCFSFAQECFDRSSGANGRHFSSCKWRCSSCVSRTQGSSRRQFGGCVKIINFLFLWPRNAIHSGIENTHHQTPQTGFIEVGERCLRCRNNTHERWWSVVCKGVFHVWSWSTPRSCCNEKEHFPFPLPFSVEYPAANSVPVWL